MLSVLKGQPEIFFFDVTVRRMLENDTRQGQKLEAVGRLAAGIAHEINTPVQYVGDSFEFINAATRDLWTLVEAYRAGRAEGGMIRSWWVA